jgi:hypothetical protein
LKRKASALAAGVNATTSAKAEAAQIASFSVAIIGPIQPIRRKEG